MTVTPYWCGRHCRDGTISRLHEKEKLMSSAPSGTTSLASGPSGALKGAAGMVMPLKPAPREPARHSKRTEDTGAGCRANAAADLARAAAPGGDYMRVRLERSAAVWTERATLLERLEKNFKRRTLAA
jgi:hypothetical protein